MNKSKLLKIVNQYIDDFEANWSREEYKWKEVKTFQDNWSLDVELISDNIKASIDLSSNLVASKNYYPINQILKLSDKRNAELKECFQNLFNEEENLEVRIKDFIECIKSLKKSVHDDTSDGRDLRFISTMLFFRYPSKYTIYKYSDLVAFNEYFETGVVITKGDISSISKSSKVIRLIRDYLLDSKHKVINIYRSKLKESKDYYKDDSLMMLAQNILWYATRYKVLDSEENYIFPKVIKGQIKESVYQAKTRTIGIKVDYEKKAIKDKNLGLKAESFVLEYENNKLKNKELKAEWVSVNQGDGLGYDILSYDEQGKEIYIEVKATAYDENSMFYITATELEAARKYQERYFLYRVFKFGTDNTIAIYNGYDVIRLCTTPSVYAVLGK